MALPKGLSTCIQSLQAQLSVMDYQFQAKLLADSEHYDEPLRDKDILRDRLTPVRAGSADSHSVLRVAQACRWPVQSQLSALDDQFQAKLLAESERYEELLRDKEALNERWDEQNKQLLQQHEQLLEEVTADCDDKVQVSLIT